MDNSDLSLHELQDFIRVHYYKHDKERGTAGTFMWFIEEVGELSTALQHISNAPDDPSCRQNLQEEFADVLGWLSTLANLHDIDLAKAVREKYLNSSDQNAHKS
ncbi:nucleotide pyrophosphohydrolase [bacterium]|nr:nucleotide pyrophosphohydrolase [bacterium]